jgi:hypothetical protein
MAIDVPPPTTRAASFPILPSPYPDESAQGYLLRAHDINGARWSDWGFRNRRLSFWSLMDSRDLSALNDLGLSSDRFALTTIRIRSKSSVALGGEEFRRVDWTTVTRRWCPACFEQDRNDESLAGRNAGWRFHRRFWWDALCVDTCPIHCVRLEKACPDCGEDLKWQAGAVTTCGVGHSILSCESVAVATEHCAADAYVVGRLGGAPRVRVPLLDRLSLGDALDVMARLGSALVGGPNAGLKNIDRERHPEVMSAGLRIADGWPTTIGPLLDSLADRSRETERTRGINDVYGELARWARRSAKTVEGRQMLDSILSHHAQRVAVNRSSAAAAFSGGSSPVNISWVMERCGKRKRKILRYVASMGIEVDISSPGFPTLRRDDAERIVAALDDAIGTEEVAALLGISSVLLARLERDGALGPAETHLRADAGQRRYSRSHIEDFIERLAGNAVLVDAAPKGLRPISDSTALIGTGGLGAVLNEIMAGRGAVKARLAGAQGLDALLIDRDEFRALRKGLDPKEIVPLKDVAKLLGVDYETASAALKMNMLDAVESAGKGTMISRKSVDAFLATYTTTPKLVGPSKAKHLRLRNLLKQMGVEPVISKADYPRCKTNLYRIAEVPVGVEGMLGEEASP